MNAKEIKQEIRKLKKLKLQCKSGSEERLSLHRKIKELKEQLVFNAQGNVDKDPIIKEIKQRDKMFGQLGIDLYKFSIVELQKHLTKLKNNDTKKE